MASMNFELTDTQVTVSITVNEQADGTLLFQLDVLDDGGSIGDLNGLFFDIADESLLDGLQISGADVTGTAVKADGVTKVDGYNNVNGDVANALGKFDVGIQFGTSGMATDDIQSTSFSLSSASGPLTLDAFLSQDFAVRLTSVGEIDGSRTDSVKIGGTAADEPIAEDPAHVANDDVLTVMQDETFEEAGQTDTLDSSAQSLLANDTTDDGAYLGDLLAANGQVLTDQITVAGSNGGLLIVHADGRLDFSANHEFIHLDGGESELTQFTYEIDGGAMANLDVFVFGLSGGDGGGPGDDDMSEDDMGDDVYDYGSDEDEVYDDAYGGDDVTDGYAAPVDDPLGGLG